MPFAVTHILASIILVDLYRDYFAKHKKYFTLHTIFIAGFAGLLPDIDIPLNWILNQLGAGLIHRTFTHTPMFALLFLVPGIVLWYRKQHKKAVYFFVASFAVFLHISMDFFFTADDDGIMFFYPFSASEYALGLLEGMSISFFAGMDAIILLLWLWHEEIKHKISDYI